MLIVQLMSTFYYVYPEYINPLFRKSESFLARFTGVQTAINILLVYPFGITKETGTRLGYDKGAGLTILRITKYIGIQVLLILVLIHLIMICKISETHEQICS
jgi:hypothetical protein